MLPWEYPARAPNLGVRSLLTQERTPEAVTAKRRPKFGEELARLTVLQEVSQDKGTCRCRPSEG